MANRSLARDGKFIGKDIISRGSGGFMLNPKWAQVRISDSEFWVGPVHSNVGNYLFMPGDVQFDNCTFVATEEVSTHKSANFITEADRNVYSANVLWNTNFDSTMTGSRLVFNKCSFLVDGKTVEASDNAYALHTDWNDASQDNRATINCGTFDPALDGILAPQCVTCVNNPDSCSEATSWEPRGRVYPGLLPVGLPVHGQVIALNGRIVRSVCAPALDRSALVEGLPPGIYVLRLVQNHVGSAENVAVGIGR